MTNRAAPVVDLPDPDLNSDELTLIHAQEGDYELFLRRRFSADSREVYIDGEIELETGDWFLQVHRYLTSGAERKKPITVYLNTGGGDVQSMFMFCDTVRSSPVPITVVGHGNVCSAGVLMLACASKRLVTRHCVMMVHQYAHDEGQSGLRYGEAKEQRKWDDWTHHQMIELMAEFSGKPVSYWKGVFEKKAAHWLLGGQDIVDEGLADGVIPWVKAR